MSEFSVDVAALRKLTLDLKGCADDLDAGLKALRDVGPKGLGYPFFDDACAHFQDKWDYGLGKVRDCIEKLNEGLEEVVKNYEATEEGVKSSVTGGNK